MVKNMTQLSLVGASPDLDDMISHLDQHGDDIVKWPQSLADFMAVTESAITRTMPDMESDSAHTLARNITISLAHYLGGRQTYLPRDVRLQRALRDYRIYRDFRGRNYEALARREGLTVTQVYNIVAAQRKLFRNRVQPGLPL